jgi:hypothetical protein
MSLCRYDAEDCADLANGSSAPTQAELARKVASARAERIAYQKMVAAFSRYDRILEYMVGEMRTNSRGHRFGYWRNTVPCARDRLAAEPWGEIMPGDLGPDAAQCEPHSSKDPALIDTNLGMLWDFYKLVTGPHKVKLNVFGNIIRLGPGSGRWDHKPILLSMFHERDTFYTPIRGDRRIEQVKFDIWSNIHYGYVGRSHGIPEDLLLSAQRQFDGHNSDADDASVQIGMRLWSQHRRFLTARDVQLAVLRTLPRYRRTPGTVKPGWW